MGKHPTCRGCNSTLNNRGVHFVASSSKHNPVRLGFCKHCITCPNREENNTLILRKGDSFAVIKNDDELVELIKGWGYN